MAPRTKGRLVILSGPSCIGKSPLAKALERFHPNLMARLRPLVLYTSRDPRPGEQDDVDYHFRSRQEIENLRDRARFIVMEVRGDLQALDLEEVTAQLGESDILFEGNPYVGRILLTHSALGEIERLSCFLSPLSREELLFLRAQPNVALEKLVTDVMRRKLLRRTRRHKGELSFRDLEEVERRASSAYRELCEAHHFSHVIANHDGEDSENWDAFYYPLGDARRTTQAAVALMEGRVHPGVERWEPDLLGAPDLRPPSRTE